MKKSTQLSQVSKKPAPAVKSRSFTWSAGKSAALRKSGPAQSRGDCNCNCGK